MGGDLTIVGTQHATPEPLAELASIGGSLVVANNPSLGNLGSLLPALAAIGGSLTILNNGALATLDGLASLHTVGGRVLVNLNGNLDSVTGLCNVSIAGPIEIHDGTLRAPDHPGCAT